MFFPCQNLDKFLILSHISHYIHNTMYVRFTLKFRSICLNSYNFYTFLLDYHVLRKPPEDMTKVALRWTPEGKRKRPKNNMETQHRKWNEMKERGYTWGSNSLKPCKICMGGSGTESCLDCQQYFCGSCKSWYKIIDTTEKRWGNLSLSYIPWGISKD
jgi:hypothetical protein